MYFYCFFSFEYFDSFDHYAACWVTLSCELVLVWLTGREGRAVRANGADSRLVTLHGGLVIPTHSGQHVKQLTASQVWNKWNWLRWHMERHWKHVNNQLFKRVFVNPSVVAHSRACTGPQQVGCGLRAVRAARWWGHWLWGPLVAGGWVTGQEVDREAQTKAEDRQSIWRLKSGLLKHCRRDGQRCT